MTATSHWLLVAAAVLLGVRAQPAAQDASDEYRLKAAFVYRFPQFVEWPDVAVRDARTLDVCVLDPNPFGSDLEQLVSGETAAGRPLRVRTVSGPEALSGCHVLFAGGHGQATAQVVKAVSDHPVLTIGETEHFLDDGGIIVLRIVGRRVRFDVSSTNARKAGLRIDPQLLSLAAVVRGGAQ